MNTHKITIEYLYEDGDPFRRFLIFELKDVAQGPNALPIVLRSIATTLEEAQIE